MKKIVMFLLCMVMLLTLTACGEKKEASLDNNGNSQKENTEVNNDEKEKEQDEIIDDEYLDDDVIIDWDEEDNTPPSVGRIIVE